MLAGLRLDGVDHVRAWRGSDHDRVRGPRSRGDRRVGRQPERTRQLREARAHGIAPGDARPSCVPVHARRRWRRRVCESGSRRSAPTSSPASPRASGAGCGPYRNCTALRRDHPDGVPRALCVSAAHGPRQRRPGLPTVRTPQARDSEARAREHGNVVSVTILSHDEHGSVKCSVTSDAPEGTARRTSSSDGQVVEDRPHRAQPLQPGSRCWTCRTSDSGMGTASRGCSSSRVRHNPRIDCTWT